MAPKSSAKETLAPEEDVLQAVILADSFNKRFKPLTTRKPRCLLPICNAPLLDWTFESLALAGVQEIFVICRSHADLVKAAIRESKWSNPKSGIKIVPIITAKETVSPGDAMRNIYTHGIITSDFVLVTGDLVSNVRIDEVVREHKERRKTNKDAIMTMVVKQSGSAHRTRSKGESSIFVMNPDTSECVHFESTTGYPPKTHARIPRDVIAAHQELDIRNDLIDCAIDVCSVDVPSLFEDNFDWQDLRRDFLNGVLTSDLLLKNIYVHVVKDGYAARVQDTRSYDSVSRDILSRWAFPLVPDDNHPAGHSYEHTRGNKYIAKDNSVVLARTCKIGNNTLIGSSSHILDNAQVMNSVIGQRCVIGAGSIIKNSYIFDDTIIGAGCVVESSIIGAGVTVKDETSVDRGCLLGDGVSVGPQAHLESFERLSKRRKLIDGSSTDGEDDSDIEEAENNTDPVISILGSGSNAIIWPKPSAADDEDLLDDREHSQNQRLMRFGDDAADLDLSDPGSVTESESDTDESESEDEDDILGVSNFGSLASSSTSSLPTVPAISDVADAAAESEFRSEVQQSLERAFAEGHSVENAAVELKTLRMASNVPLSRVREEVIASVVERIRIEPEGGPAQRVAIAEVIDRWGMLINKIGGVDAVESVSILQTHCASSERLALFGQILAAMYQADVVDEDDIRAWHKIPTSRGLGLKPGAQADNIKKCWDVGAHMIFQFDQQDDDSDEDEDESDADATPNANSARESDESEDEIDAKPSSGSDTMKAQIEVAQAESDESDPESEDDLVSATQLASKNPTLPEVTAKADVTKSNPKAVNMESESEEDDSDNDSESDQKPVDDVKPLAEATDRVAEAVPGPQDLLASTGAVDTVSSEADSSSEDEDSEAEAASSVQVSKSKIEPGQPFYSAQNQAISLGSSPTPKALLHKKSMMPPARTWATPPPANKPRSASFNSPALTNVAISTEVERASLEKPSMQGAGLLNNPAKGLNTVAAKNKVASVGGPEPSESEGSDEDDSDESDAEPATAAASKSTADHYTSSVESLPTLEYKALDKDTNSKSQKVSPATQSSTSSVPAPNSEESSGAEECESDAELGTGTSNVLAEKLEEPESLTKDRSETNRSTTSTIASELRAPDSAPLPATVTVPAPLATMQSQLAKLQVRIPSSFASPPSASSVESPSGGSEGSSEVDSGSEESESESESSDAAHSIAESRSRSATVTKASILAATATATAASAGSSSTDARPRSSTVTQQFIRPPDSDANEDTTSEEETDDDDEQAEGATAHDIIQRSSLQPVAVISERVEVIEPAPLVAPDAEVPSSEEEEEEEETSESGEEEEELTSEEATQEPATGTVRTASSIHISTPSHTNTGPEASRSLMHKKSMMPPTRTWASPPPVTKPRSASFTSKTQATISGTTSASDGRSTLPPPAGARAGPQWQQYRSRQSLENASTPSSSEAEDDDE